MSFYHEYQDIITIVVCLIPIIGVTILLIMNS